MPCRFFRPLNGSTCSTGLTNLASGFASSPSAISRSTKICACVRPVARWSMPSYQRFGYAKVLNRPGGFVLTAGPAVMRASARAGSCPLLRSGSESLRSGSESLRSGSEWQSCGGTLGRDSRFPSGMTEREARANAGSDAELVDFPRCSTCDRGFPLLGAFEGDFALAGDSGAGGRLDLMRRLRALISAIIA